MSVTPPPALMSTACGAGALPCAWAVTDNSDASEQMRSGRESRIEFSLSHGQHGQHGCPFCRGRGSGVDGIGTRCRRWADPLVWTGEANPDHWSGRSSRFHTEARSRTETHGGSTGRAVAKREPCRRCDRELDTHRPDRVSVSDLSTRPAQSAARPVAVELRLGPCRVVCDDEPPMPLRSKAGVSVRLRASVEPVVSVIQLRPPADPWPPSPRRHSRLQRIPRPVLARQEVVRGDVVRDAHVGGVVVQLRVRAQRDDAEQHDLGELGGVVERHRDLVGAL